MYRMILTLTDATIADERGDNERRRLHTDPAAGGRVHRESVLRYHRSQARPSVHGEGRLGLGSTLFRQGKLSD